MSTRAIASVVGAHKDTVRNDLRGGENSPPGDSTPVEPVTGLDGKKYRNPPKKKEPPAVTVTSERPPQTSGGPKKKDLPVLQNVIRGINVYLVALDAAITHGLDDSVTGEEAGAASADLSRCLTALNKLNRQLKNRQEQS